MIVRMNNLKQLIVTKDSKLYQRENIVEKLLFLLPITYNDIKLAPFTVTWEYVNPQGIAKAEILDIQEDLYKDQYLQYILPVDSEMAYFAGDITGKISAVWVDPDTTQRYVLHTSEVTITISKLSDYYALVDDKTLETIDEKILNLNAQIGALDMVAQQLQLDQVDDLNLDTNNILRVSANGVPKGTGIEILTNVTDSDGYTDGILDLEDATDIEGGDDIIPIIDL